MNKVFLMLTLFVCASPSMADDMKVTTLLASNSNTLTGIEQKNRAIMSDFKTYFIASRKQGQLKQSLAEQQYSRFVKNKRAL
jgi:hypothetical protein